MKFSKRLFLAIFLVAVGTSSALLWTIHFYSRETYIGSFISRYRVAVTGLADTLIQLESTTETLMRSAAQVVAAEDKQKGLLDTDTLRKIRDSLGISHIFIVNKTGKFVRSTNEDPDLIPNLFSFCEKYKGLVTGSLNLEATPIIPPQPEPNPYKFLSIPNHDRTRIIEIGVRASFIGDILTKALLADKNILSLELFAPDGTSLGRFGKDVPSYQREKVALPSFSEPLIVESKGEFTSFSKVFSQPLKCCECDVFGISKDGDYNYVLKARISRNELTASLNRISRFFLWAQLGVLLLSWGVSALIARKVARRFTQLSSAVRKVGQTSSFQERINLSGKDEVAAIANSVDQMLDKLEQAQRVSSDTQAKEAMIKMAKQVAHDIKSPLSALRIYSESTKSPQGPERSLVRTAVQRIEEIANSLTLLSSNRSTSMEPTLLSGLVSELLNEKKSLAAAASGLTLAFETVPAARFAFVQLNSADLKRAISNIIDNAIEAVDPQMGRIVVKQTIQGNHVSLVIQDNGSGIPAEVLKDLNQNLISSNKAGGQGLGVSFAREVVERTGGSFQIESLQGVGTKIIIGLPTIRTPSWFAEWMLLTNTTHLVVVDDDPSVLHAWKIRKDPDLLAAGRLHCFERVKDLEDFLKRRPANCKFIVDFELPGEQDGIEIIEKHGLSQASIVITSHWEDRKLIERCKALQIRLFPKSLTAFFELRVIESEQRDLDEIQII